MFTAFSSLSWRYDERWVFLGAERCGEEGGGESGGWEEEVVRVCEEMAGVV